MEGSEYNLTCIVSGYQALMANLTYQWFSDFNTLQNPADQITYAFNMVNRYDNGTYFCQVTISSPLLNNDIVEQNGTTIEVIGKNK